MSPSFENNAAGDVHERKREPICPLTGLHNGPQSVSHIRLSRWVEGNLPVLPFSDAQSMAAYRTTPFSSAEASLTCSKSPFRCSWLAFSTS